MQNQVQISGSCHCRNIQYVLEWPGSTADIAARVCGCSFCRKVGGAWTSNTGAKLISEIKNEAAISKYRFGTATADFHVCSLCGSVPYVISDIGQRLYAVVNVNTFDSIDSADLKRSPSNFDGEGTGDRLERRKRNWISDVRIVVSDGAAATPPEEVR